MTLTEIFAALNAAVSAVSTKKSARDSAASAATVAEGAYRDAVTAVADLQKQANDEIAKQTGMQTDGRVRG